MRNPEFMGATVRIEVDKHTADMLQSRATELGVAVQALVAELAALDSGGREADASEITELDRRYARATQSERVLHERVVHWLRTWGTSAFRPWPGR